MDQQPSPHQPISGWTKLKPSQASPRLCASAPMLDLEQSVFLQPELGWVAEWSNAAVLKTAVRVTVPGVRIPPHPLIFRVASRHFIFLPARLKGSPSRHSMIESTTTVTIVSPTTSPVTGPEPVKNLLILPNATKSRRMIFGKR